MKKTIGIVLSFCIIVSAFSCVASAGLIDKLIYLDFVKDIIPSFSELINEMILPEFESVSSLTDIVMAMIRSVNGLLFALPHYAMVLLALIAF